MRKYRSCSIQFKFRLIVCIYLWYECLTEMGEIIFTLAMYILIVLVNVLLKKYMFCFKELITSFEFLVLLPLVWLVETLIKFVITSIGYDLPSIVNRIQKVKNFVFITVYFVSFLWSVHSLAHVRQICHVCRRAMCFLLPWVIQHIFSHRTAGPALL